MTLTKLDLDRVLMSPKPYEALEHLNVSGQLGSLPEVSQIVGFGGKGHKDLWDHTKKVVAQTVPRLRVRWAALFHDVGKVKTFEFKDKVTFHGHEALSAKLFNQAARRLGFEDGDRKHIRFVIYHLGHLEGYDASWTDSAVRRVTKLAGEHLDDMVALSRADITTRHDYKRKQHHAKIADFVRRSKAIAAQDAIVPALPKGLGDVISERLGVDKGPELGALMKALKAAVEAGELPRQGQFDEYLGWLKDHAG